MSDTDNTNTNTNDSNENTDEDVVPTNSTNTDANGYDPITQPYLYFADNVHLLDITDNKYLEYYGTHDVSIDNTQNSAKRLIINVHGKGRNAPITFGYTLSTQNVTNTNNETIVLSPYFTVDDWERLNRDDIIKWNPTTWYQGAVPDNTYYTTGNKLYYADSENRRQRVTAFSVLDKLIETTLINNPSIYEITIGGWSAGAQLIQRYLITSPLLKTLNEHNYAVRPLIFSSGSFAYLDEKRPDLNIANQYCKDNVDTCDSNYSSLVFNIPSNTCDNTYNKWRYGLDVSDADFFEVQKGAYEKYNVRYFVGDNDFTPPDQFCATSLQGETRFQRALLFIQHAKQFDAGSNLTLFPNCRHSEYCASQTTEFYEAFQPGPVVTPTQIALSTSSGNNLALNNSFFGIQLLGLMIVLSYYVLFHHK